MTSRLAQDPARRCLKPAAWPEQDRTLWQNAIDAGDLLEAQGTRANHARASNHSVEGSYGRFLEWLAHAGQFDPALPPAGRITKANVGSYLQALADVGNSTATQARRLVELHIAATVMDPSANWQWIYDIAARVRHRHRPVRDKRSRIVGVDDLELLGLSLMQQAEDSRKPPRQRALLYRDGLIIVALIARPLRRKNFAALEFDRQFQRQGAHRHLHIPAVETKVKDGNPIEQPWPEDLTPALETYLAVYRPILLARPSRWTASRPAAKALWVSGHGSAMGDQALYDLVVKHTLKAFGRSLSPHLFRDCAATGIAIDDPEHVRIIGPLLGHNNHLTAERYYNQAQTVEAARQWQQNLARLRQKPGSKEVVRFPAIAFRFR